MAWPNPRFRLYGLALNYPTIAARMLTGRWNKGIETGLLERAVERQVETDNAICCAKGRVAIFLAVRALVKSGQ